MKVRSFTEYKLPECKQPDRHKAKRSATTILSSIDVVETNLEELALDHKSDASNEGETQVKAGLQDESKEELNRQEEISHEQLCLQEQVRTEAMGLSQCRPIDRLQGSLVQHYWSSAGKEPEDVGTDFTKTSTKNEEEENENLIEHSYESLDDSNQEHDSDDVNSSIDASFEYVHRPLKDLIYKTNKDLYDVDSRRVKYKAGLSKRGTMLPSLHPKKRTSH